MTPGIRPLCLVSRHQNPGIMLAMAVQDGQHSGPGRHYTTDADYPRLVMDAVDMLDFANGETHDVNANLSRWAKLRHDMGHRRCATGAAVGLRQGPAPPHRSAGERSAPRCGGSSRANPTLPQRPPAPASRADRTHSRPPSRRTGRS